MSANQKKQREWLCMQMVVAWYILIELELNSFQKKFIGIKIFIKITNIYRTQACDSIMFR